MIKLPNSSTLEKAISVLMVILPVVLSVSSKLKK